MYIFDGSIAATVALMPFLAVRRPLSLPATLQGLGFRV